MPLAHDYHFTSLPVAKVRRRAHFAAPGHPDGAHQPPAILAAGEKELPPDTAAHPPAAQRTSVKLRSP